MPFSSPKRKRVEEASIEEQVPHQAASLVPRFLPRLPNVESEGQNSPRTYVAGKFQRLELERPIPDFELEPDDRDSKRLAYDNDPSPDPVQLTPASFEQAKTVQDEQSETKPPSAAAFTFENDHSPSYPSATPERPKSPGLLDGDTISDQYWHESEITGHDPDDPSDDGYGINGIGFKPTPAIAWARSQKRKQQLELYRSREAKEARQRRSERRKVGSGDFSVGSPKSSRVRFEDG